MPRIICVSNRVSLPDPATGEIKAGGLAVGVRAALESQGGGIWFGWSGEIAGSPAMRDQSPPQRLKRGNIEFYTIPLTHEEYNGYYKSMANEMLWPFMHELNRHISGNRSSYATYKSVNELFACHIRMILQPDDIIWVHDYHLIPLGQALRQLGVHNQIAYFHHIPIPSKQSAKDNIVPSYLKEQYKRLIENLFAYDQVGFQSFRDFKNFKDYTEVQGPDPNRFETGILTLGNRKTKFGVFPISIETGELEKKSCELSAHQTAQKISKNFASCRMLIGAERLDYTKGLPYRIKGVSNLLTNYPEYSHKIKYMQVNPLSRSDISKYKIAINRTRQAIARIQGRFGDQNWEPVLYSEKMMPRDRLMGYFRQSMVGLVTPLIDGQNLVAKEYIAAQNPLDPGVLVLSKHAGAAEELGQLGALLIDPRDPEDIADKINKALKIPLEQRIGFHHQAIAHLRRYDVAHWASIFIENIRGASSTH